MRTKLQIERKGYVDLYEDVSIPITKTLADIRDLSQRTGAYSTSIEVPGSKNNMNLFGHLYDMNIQNNSFDLKRKYTCVVIKDDQQIFQGYIKLEGINKYEGPNGDTIITFSINLQDSISNFYGKIKDKYINPSENVSNLNNIYGNNNTGINTDNIWWDDLILEKYNYPHIYNTFTNTYENKWKFFLPSTTKGYYETTDFKPAVYLYEYLDRIISSVGYKWNGSKTLNHIITNTRFISIDHYDILMDHTYIISDGYKVGDIIIVGNLYRGEIVSISTGGFTLDTDTGVTGIDGVYTVSINRSEFADPVNWNLLNKSIKLDKLIVPYAGGKDVLKDLTEYNVYAGLHLLYYTNTRAWTFTNSTSKLEIAWGSVGEAITNIGDIVRVKHSDSSLLGYTYYYFQVVTKLGTPSSGYWDYTVKCVDENWLPITTISNMFDFDEVNLYRGLLYPLCQNFDLYDDYAYMSPEVSGTFNSAEYLTWFNIEDESPYYDGENSYSVNYANIVSGINFPIGSYIAKNNGTLNIDLSQNYDILMDCDYDCWAASDVVGGSQLYLALDVDVYKNGTILNKYSKKLTIDTYGPDEYPNPEGYPNGKILSNASKLLPIQTYYVAENTTLPSSVKVYHTGLNYLFSDELNEIITMPVVIGDNIKVSIKAHLFSPNKDSYFYKSTNLTTDPWVEPIFKIRPKVNSTIRYSLTGNYQEDDNNVKIKDFIPKKIKQSDFLIGICKIFNLFIDYDETKKQLLILPRDEYYSLGKTIDWSVGKLDTSNKNNVLFFPDLKYKTYIYSYKQDGDQYNTDYYTATKQIYGQVSITFDNDLLVGANTIDSIFTSTPIARIGGDGIITENGHSVTTTKTDGNLLSIIDYSQNVGLKCLYDGGLISDGKSIPFLFRVHTASSSLPTLPSGNTYLYTYDIAADTVNSLPAYKVGFTKYKKTDSKGSYLYPYVGHLYPGPTQPASDLNYAKCSYYFFNDILITTQNNQYYNHYERTIRQQNEGKLLKARIRLNPTEIKNINFYDTIFIFDTYWHFNSIKYNANDPDIYDIELISI